MPRLGPGSAANSENESFYCAPKLLRYGSRQMAAGRWAASGSGKKSKKPAGTAQHHFRAAHNPPQQKTRDRWACYDGQDSGLEFLLRPQTFAFADNHVLPSVMMGTYTLLSGNMAR